LSSLLPSLCLYSVHSRTFLRFFFILLLLFSFSFFFTM
jgi:hypothetical protein